MIAASMGSFRLRELIPLGQGGMGATYLGCTQGAGAFERLVVIKRLHERFAGDDLATRRLMKEAELAGFVRHVNVVAVQQVDRDARGTYLVLDYVEGGSLRDLLDIRNSSGAGPIERPIALRILLDSLAGLAAIHETRDHQDRPLKILHRDVSPENILVGVDGVSRLCDFGIAKAFAGRMRGGANQAAGKPPYLAPECLEGAALGRRMDIYSLGVTAHEMLAGRSPWEGLEETQILARAITRGVPALQVEGMEPTLGSLVAKACARRPELRFGTAREMAAALLAIPDVTIATHSEVARFVRNTLGESLKRRRREAAQLLASQGESFDDESRVHLIHELQQGSAEVPARMRSQELLLRLLLESWNSTSDTASDERRSNWWFWLRLGLGACSLAVLGFLCAMGFASLGLLWSDAPLGDEHSTQ